MPPSTLLAIALMALLPSAFAASTCETSCEKSLREGHAFAAKGNYREAIARFEAAAAASPASSVPLSSIAGVLTRLAQGVQPAQAGPLREQARAAARRALQRDPDDALARESLRQLDDPDGAPPLRAANPAAARVLAEAEVLFAEDRFAEALKKYQEAAALDPQASTPWVGAGDCHYFQGQWSKAEPFFLRATEIEPGNAQAWRFLSDARLQQGQVKEAEQALLSAIAADPAQLSSWNKLARLRSGSGMPLKALRLERGARVSIGDDGKAEVALDAELVKSGASPDSALRLALAVAEANARSGDQEKRRPPFEIEVEAWRTALRVIDEADHPNKRRLSDPALLRMQGFARDGQLEAAILVLLFKQSYRPALQAWMAREPRGLQYFIDRYGLQP